MQNSSLLLPEVHFQGLVLQISLKRMHKTKCYKMLIIQSHLQTSESTFEKVFPNGGGGMAWLAEGRLAGPRLAVIESDWIAGMQKQG